jgi:hypothetical protein
MGAIPEQSFTVRVPAWWDDKASTCSPTTPAAKRRWRRRVTTGTCVSGRSRSRGVTEAARLRWQEAQRVTSSTSARTTASPCASARTRSSASRTACPYDVAEALSDRASCTRPAARSTVGAVLPHAAARRAGHDHGRQLDHAAVRGPVVGARRLGIVLGAQHERPAGLREHRERVRGRGQEARHELRVPAHEERHGSHRGGQEGHQGRPAEPRRVRAGDGGTGRDPVTPEQRDLFVSTIIGDRDGIVSKSAARRRASRPTSRASGRRSSRSSWADHPGGARADGLRPAPRRGRVLRPPAPFRSKDSYVKRTLLTDNPAKANLNRTIRELVAA